MGASAMVVSAVDVDAEQYKSDRKGAGRFDCDHLDGN